MIGIKFTYCAHLLDTGLHEVHLFIKQLEPTWDGTPRGERLAILDAAKVVDEIVGENCDPEKHEHPENRLLQRGEPDASYFPVFSFTIGVSWNRAAKCPHYSRVGYERIEMDGKWNPIASLGMEQYEYTMGCLRRYEKKLLATRKGRRCA